MLQPEILITLLVFGGQTIVAVIHKKFRYALIYITFCGMLTVLIAGIYYRGDSDSMMAKNLLPLLLAYFIPGAISLNAFAGNSSSGYKSIMVIGTLFFAVWNLNVAREAGLTRLKKLEKLNDHVKQTVATGKLLLHDDRQLAAEWLGVNWALPYESMLFSSWKDKPGHNQVSIRLADARTDRESAWKGYFLGAPFEPPLRVEKLNTRYFSLTDSGYQHQELHLILPLK